MAVMVAKRKQAKQVTQANNKLVPLNYNKLANDFQFLLQANFSKVLGKLNPHQIVRFALKAIRQNPKLAECDKISLLKALLEAADLDLNPDGLLGEAYIVPYNREAQLIVGYRGLIKLALNSKKVKHVEARIVYEKDKFGVELGTEGRLVHKPYVGSDPGEKVAVYAVAYLSDGTKVFEVLFKRDIEKIKELALSKMKNPKSSPWVQFEEEMWKKTAVRRLMKYLPLSAQLATAVSVDEYREAGIEADFVDVEEVEIEEEQQENQESEAKEAKESKSVTEKDPRIAIAKRIKELQEELKLTDSQLLTICHSAGLVWMESVKDLKKASQEELEAVKAKLEEKLGGTK